MSDSVDLALFQAVVDSKVTLAKAKIQAEFKEEINQSIKAGLDDALKDFRDQVKNEIELVTRTVRAEAEGQTAKALQEVASTSVDKTLKIVSEMRFWLASIIAVLLIATGVFGWQFYDKMMKTVEDKVNGWLAVDEGSPVRTKLEELRTRTLLDAYLIKAAKRVHGDRFATHIDLGVAELRRLTHLMKDPKTSDIDFLDAAKVIAMSRDFGRRFFPDQNLAEVATAVFETKQFSADKKYDLLTAWGNEAVILPYAEKMLEESTAVPEVYKNAAFRIVARRDDGGKALEYALRQLGKGGKTANIEELAAFIALTDPLNEALRQWISSPSNKRLQSYPLVLADIAQSMCQALEKTSYPNEVVKVAGAALSEAIETGVTLDVMEPFGGGYDDIGFSSKRTNTQVKFLRAFLQANSVITAVLQAHTGSSTEFGKYVRALQITKGVNRIAELSANVHNGGVFVLRNGQSVSALVTDEPVLMRTSPDQVTSELTIRWRSKNGAYTSGVLDKIENGSAMDFSYSFDPEIIGKLEMRRTHQHFLN
jgi:hypothetical protein